jgi:DUF1680 family protein
MIRNPNPFAALVVFLVLSAFNLAGHADISLPPSTAVKIQPVATLQAQPFALDRVRLLAGPFREAMYRDGRYLLELDPDRLLHTFRLNAGLPSSAEPLGGWEAPTCEVRGHFVGHYLSACALMYAATGEEAYRRRSELMVEELAKCQRALGSSGYLSAYPESFIDRVETLKPVWAPYYTLHKILAGLLEVHVHCRDSQALVLAEGMARWCQARCEKLSDGEMQQMLNHTEQGGMNEALGNLYALTGKSEYLALASRFVQRAYNDPLAAGRDELQGQHVNSFIPNIVGTARHHELTGNQKDRRVAQFFWHQVTGHRCYCTGGTSNREHWRTQPDRLAGELGDHTQETCCTYNLLKLTRHLFAWEPQAIYADYYERALWNSILSTQDPQTGMMMYFVTLGAGRWKYFNLPTESFWCCTGTGVENHAKYGDSAYFHDREGLFVNQFIPSELNWTEKGVRIRQETSFPELSATTLRVFCRQPTEFTLRVRIPSWATQGLRVRLNGESTEADSQKKGYFVLKRCWGDGDAIEVSMPMRLQIAPLPDDPTTAAFMLGPIVLAGKLGGEGLTHDMVYTRENWYAFPRDQIATAPALVAESSDLTSCLEPVAGQPLTYRTVGLDENITLVPYHQLFGARYVVYWRMFQRGSPEHVEYLARQKARQLLLSRSVDEVRIGDAQSEKSHGLLGEHTASGVHQGRVWRDASRGGQFMYRLAVDPRQPMSLLVAYWGSDSGRRIFDVLVDDQIIATQRLQREKPDEFFDVEYAIPPAVTAGKKEVTVRFQAHPDCMAGGVFGLNMLRAAEKR